MAIVIHLHTPNIIELNYARKNFFKLYSWFVLKVVFR